MATDKKGLREPKEQIILPVFVKKLNKKSSYKILMDFLMKTELKNRIWKIWTKTYLLKNLKNDFTSISSL